jgi:hypothetical protein
VDRRRNPDDLGLRRAATAHRHDHDTPIGGKEACDMPRDRRLPHPLARADDRQGGHVDRRERRRVEAEVGPFVGDPVGEHAARERHALDRSEHGLVGEIEHQIRRVGGDRLLHLRHERHAVVVSAPQLLGSAEEHGRDDVMSGGRERITYHRRVVLAVDQRDRPHVPGRLPPLAGAVSGVPRECEALSGARAGLRRKAAAAPGT